MLREAGLVLLLLLLLQLVQLLLLLLLCHDCHAVSQLLQPLLLIQTNHTLQQETGRQRQQ